MRANASGSVTDVGIGLESRNPDMGVSACVRRTP